MADLKILTQFCQLFDEVKHCLKNYNENLKNNTFDRKENETNENAYKRGEGIFDQFDENLTNINIILKQENEINTFFNECKENKQKIIDYKNELIDKLLQIKKESSTKEEYNKQRKEWNEKREESPDKKNRRECEEMLEDIKQEKFILMDLKSNIKYEQDKLEKQKQEIKELIQSTKIDEFKKEMNENIIAISNNVSQFMSKLNASESNEHQKEITKPFMKEDCNLTSNQVKQLEDWTQMKCSDVLFDSTVDDWSHGSNIFNKRITGQRRLMFLLENEDGEKDGYYLNTMVIEKYTERVSTDIVSFHFNLESKGRLSEPMKFEIKDINEGGYVLYDEKEYRFVNLGNIALYKDNWKGQSTCWQNNTRFDYKGIDRALCGKEYNTYKEYIKPKRILVIRMTK